MVCSKAEAEGGQVRVFQGEAPRPLGPSTGSPARVSYETTGSLPTALRAVSPFKRPARNLAAVRCSQGRKGQDRRLSARLPPSRCSQGSAAGCPAMPGIPLAGSQARSRHPAIAAGGCDGRQVAGSGPWALRPHGLPETAPDAPPPSSSCRPAALVPGSWSILIRYVTSFDGSGAGRSKGRKSASSGQVFSAKNRYQRKRAMPPPRGGSPKCWGIPSCPDGGGGICFKIPARMIWRTNNVRHDP